MMRKAEFEVPAEVFGDFVEKLTEAGLDNRVLGKNEDDEIEIVVSYDKEDAGLIDELEVYLEELIEGLDNEDDDEG